ncbi:M24 family metallopeptidase [Williamsia sterculiae]|uniref:Metallopeptidase family M24 n=1 Tax=Williamsia sterculiae TaxID=1344003 RepID=A0A1N7EH72_9NOCA|nr:M24 family metallopeptidase [Williamsia sterculiae]SIR87394.1 Metallopeptidase family M24 [Williamsia sterculiae]
MGDVSTDEQTRVTNLLDAQRMAVGLFDAITEQGLIRPGVSERQVSDEVRDLAAEMYGVSRFWHKRIVRGGVNTLQPYRENPPDRTLTDDDIAFVDFGPVFEGWEADFGRTYVLGADPRKQALRDALPTIFDAGRCYFDSHPEVTGEELYQEVVRLAEQDGWEFGGEIAGHLVGEFPHEKIRGDEVLSYIAPGSTTPMRRLDGSGRPCHWILEIHLVDRDRGIGGFHEELLDIGHR